jgi:hypothetical protein
MGSNGNNQVVGCYDSRRVLKDDDKPSAITMTYVADVPEVDGATLDLSRFTAHLDHAKLTETPSQMAIRQQPAKCPNRLSAEESIPLATR